MIDPGRMRVVVEQFAVPLFALLQQLFHTPALGNIAGDLGKSTQFPGAVGQSSQEDVRPKSRSVLSYPRALVLVAALGDGGLDFVLRLAFLHVFWRVEAGEMPAYDFIGLVTFDAFRPVVPTGHTSSGIEHEDGVIPYVVYQQTKALLTFTQCFVYPLAFSDVPRNSIDDFLLGCRNSIPRKPFVGTVFA